MSYISAIRSRDEVIVWERSKEEGRTFKTFAAPYYFFAPVTNTEHGEYTSMFGEPLKKYSFDTNAEFRAAKDQILRENSSNPKFRLYESDIPPELKILSEHYYNAEPPELHIAFIDIEVDYKPELGFASADHPYAPINSVAITRYWEDRTFLLFVPPPGMDKELYDVDTFRTLMEKEEPFNPDEELEIFICANEEELLLTMLQLLDDADVVSGWNSDFFDLPYIGRRVLDVLGDRYFNELSFPLAGRPRFYEIERFGNPATMLQLGGRISLDYLQLFRKYEVAERPSYKLENISEEVLPDMRKLDYDGSLAELYIKDPVRFARYNLRDTEILSGFERVLGYVNLANVMYHISCGLAQHVGGVLKLAELATNNFCIHERSVRVPDNEIQDNTGGIQGALVLYPQVGMQEWIGSIDINSLYPSVIRSINISPETLVGQFSQCARAQEEIHKRSAVELEFVVNDTNESMFNTADEWADILLEQNWSVSGYGTVFDQKVKGVIPSIIEDWYETRKKYKALSKSVDDPGEARYNDRLQYVYKIKLNSFYGALNNAFFRYFDLRMGESTTGTGRKILSHMCAAANEALVGEYELPFLVKTEEEAAALKHPRDHYIGYTDEYAVIYGDTDSAYFRTYGQNGTESIEIANAVAEYVNQSFPAFMQSHFLVGEDYKDIVQAGREIVAQRGIFVDKKRYILNVVDDEGDTVDKLKVMGLDTKKTTIQKWISTTLNDFIGRILRGEEWGDVAEDIISLKDYVQTTDDWMSIGIPKGVNGISEYTFEYKRDKGTRLPGHVAASILYNMCLEEFGDHDNPPIVSGTKIRIFYLSKKYGRFRSIAVPSDSFDVPEWLRHNFDIDREAHIERLVDNPLTNIIKAINYTVPSRQSMLIDDLLEF